VLFRSRREGRNVHKTVVFFLAETSVEKVTLSFEHQDYGWFDFEEASKKVTYPNARRLLREAESMTNGDRTPSTRADVPIR
jgi:8-oxo-dGTP pyrophosphatase MutT (NUDIX family)